MPPGSSPPPPGLPDLMDIDLAGLDLLQNFTPGGYVGAIYGLKRGRDEETDQPASSKLARREHATDVTSASRIPQIIPSGTVLPLWGLGDADGVLGYITVDNYKIDAGGSAHIVGGKTADGCKVALKVFTPMHDHQLTLIRRELDTVRKLAPHRNILSFLGTCQYHNAVLVSPFMRNGNLSKYLERYPTADRHRLVVQVAEALCHVHDVLKLVHGDLKGENVLISDEGDALLADFGLSTAIDKAASDVTTVLDIRQKSTLRFNAPELMLDEVQEVDESGRLRLRSKTTATDMYAFGMLVLQAFTNQHPWPHLREMQVITTVCNMRRIHPRPDVQSHAVAMGFTDQHWAICSSCWNFEPHDRPKIRHVLSALVQSTIREGPMWSSVQALDPEREWMAYIDWPGSLQLHQRLEQFTQGLNMSQLQQTSMAQMQHQHQQSMSQPRPTQVTMPALAGPLQIQLHQPRAFWQRHPSFGEPPPPQSSLGRAPSLPSNELSLDAISHQQMTRFAASQNTRLSEHSHIVPIQDLGEWRAIFEKLLTMCNEADDLLPHAYNIQPDQNIAKMFIDIKLAASEQQQHCIASLSPMHQRVFLDIRVLQRFIALVSDWTMKARALVQAYRQQHGIQQHQMPPQSPPALGSSLTQAPPPGGLNQPIRIPTPVPPPQPPTLAMSTSSPKLAEKFPKTKAKPKPPTRRRASQLGGSTAPTAAPTDVVAKSVKRAPDEDGPSTSIWRQLEMPKDITSADLSTSIWRQLEMPKDITSADSSSFILRPACRCRPLAY